MNKYIFPNESKTDIIESRWANSKKVLKNHPEKGTVIAPTHDDYIEAGWFLWVTPDTTNFQRPTNVYIFDDVLKTATKETEHRPELELKSGLSTAIYARCNYLMEQVRGGYSVVEVAEWQKTEEIYKVWHARGRGDLTAEEKEHFAGETGLMSIQVYFETRVADKACMGIAFKALLKSTRTNYTQSLNQSTYEQMKSFGYLSNWKDKDSFSANKPDGVTQVKWDTYLSMFEWS